MKTRFYVVLAVTCIFTLLLIRPVCANTFTLKFNYSIPPKKSIAGSWHWYGDMIEKATNSQVKFQYFPLGGLFKAKNTRDNMIAGTADICELSISTEGQRMPFASISTLPTIPFPDTVAGTIAATEVMIQLVEEFPELADEFRSWKVLGFQYLIPYGIFANKQINTPSDIKGLKIRASDCHADFIHLCGGGAVNIVPPEMYMSLKTGVLNGGIITLSMVGDYELWETGKFFTDVYLGRSLFAIIMNKASWNNLPADFQKVMMEFIPGMVKSGAEIMVANNEQGKKLFIDHGGVVIQTTSEQLKEWDNAKAPLEEMWLENFKKTGNRAVAEKMLKRFKDLSIAKTVSLK